MAWNKIPFCVQNSNHYVSYMKLPDAATFIAVTWASWRLKSPATYLFVQQLVEACNKRNINCSFVVVTSSCWHNMTNATWSNHVTFLSQCHHQSNYMLERSAYCWFLYHCITVTSQRAQWRLKSPASQFYSTIHSGADQRNIKAPRHWPLCIEIHRWPVNSLNKGPVARKLFPFDDVIMEWRVTTMPHNRALPYRNPLI